MKYVYCLARDTSVFEVLPSGLAGAEIHHISHRGISALISDVDPCQLANNSVRNALAHGEVVDAALRVSKSIIPCRFGTSFSNDRQILTFLKKHYSLLDAQLTKLQGKMEVSVQVIFDRGRITACGRGIPPTTPRGMGDFPHPEKSKAGAAEQQLAPGMAYLLRKKEQFDAIKGLDEEVDRFSQELNKALSPLWSDVKVQKRSTDKAILVNLCYLVDQQGLSAFKRAYESFKTDKASFKLLYTGPWPPYSFTGIDLRRDKE